MGHRQEPLGIIPDLREGLELTHSTSGGVGWHREHPAVLEHGPPRGWVLRREAGEERAEMLEWEMNAGAGMGQGAEPHSTHRHVRGWGAPASVSPGRNKLLQASELILS